KVLVATGQVLDRRDQLAGRRRVTELVNKFHVTPYTMADESKASNSVVYASPSFWTAASVSNASVASILAIAKPTCASTQSSGSGMSFSSSRTEIDRCTPLTSTFAK